MTTQYVIGYQYLLLKIITKIKIYFAEQVP